MAMAMAVPASASAGKKRMREGKARKNRMVLAQMSVFSVSVFSGEEGRDPRQRTEHLGVTYTFIYRLITGYTWQPMVGCRDTEPPGHTESTWQVMIGCRGHRSPIHRLLMWHDHIGYRETKCTYW